MTMSTTMTMATTMNTWPYHDHGHDHGEIVVLPEAGEAQLSAATESADKAGFESQATREQERVETDQANQQATADQAEDNPTRNTKQRC